MAVTSFPWRMAQVSKPSPILAAVTTEDVFAVIQEEINAEVAHGRACIAAIFGTVL
jgi:hypothetical protein